MKEKFSGFRGSFKGVHRNSPCPCGSGEKFKSCHGSFVPNHIDRATRIINTAYSLALITWGTYGVIMNDLVLPGKRRGRGDVHFLHLHDAPLWLMYAAMICGSLTMLSVVVDHYDRRNNEAAYKRFSSRTALAGYLLFFSSLLLFLFQNAKFNF